MRDKLIPSFIGAVVGSGISVAAVFFLQYWQNNDSLEVKNLKITQQLVLLDKDGKESLIIRDGSVIATQAVLGKKIIGAELQGQTAVVNRLLASPDDLSSTPPDQLRYLTEIGCAEKTGGEIIVRSGNGANIIGEPINNGVYLRTGFDERENLQSVVWSNQGNKLVPQFPPQQINPSAKVTRPAEPWQVVHKDEEDALNSDANTATRPEGTVKK